MKATEYPSKLRFIRGTFDWTEVNFPCTEIGDSVYFTLDSERRARVDLMASIRSDQWVGLQVTIINKASGKIDQKDFLWTDYFYCANDNRKPMVVLIDRFHWADDRCNYQVPLTRMEVIVIAINEYLQLFR